MTLEEKTDDIVAYGTIISINCNMLHIDCMCVTIDQTVDIDVLLPLLLLSSCQYVDDAVRYHVNWPTNFIKVQHEMMDENKLDKFRFVHSYRVGHLPTIRTDKQFLQQPLESKTRALADKLFDTPTNTTLLVPCNIGVRILVTMILSIAHILF
nr:uncharacterized protein LOC109166346 [Ipomoea batatas]